MRGRPRFNFAAFDAARDRARALGHEPISPADLDREMGFDETKFDDFPMPPKSVIIRDVIAVSESEAIALLPGWQGSVGARAELAIAMFLNLKILEAENFTPINVVLAGASFV